MSREFQLLGLLEQPATLLLLLSSLGALAFFFVRRTGADRRLRERVNDAGGRPHVDTSLNTDDPLDSWFSMRLSHAGVAMNVSQLMAIAVLCSIACGLTLLLLTNETAAGAGGMIVGFGIPLVALAILARTRRKKLQNQIPDAFFLLARAMRAGSGLERSLSLCAEQTDSPLHEELEVVLHRMDLGLSVSHALRLMGDRLKLEDIDMLISTIQVHETAGGDLARLIDRVATGARHRSEFRRQVMAATSMSRISAIFISAAQPIILLIYALSPQSEILTSFLAAPEGKVALGLSVFLEIVGVLWLLAILRVKL